MIRAALMICLAMTAAPVVGYQTMPEMIGSAYEELDSLRAALPEDWEEFLDDVCALIAPYGECELFDSSLRARGVRGGEYIYCSVSFQPDGRTYYYRTDDDTLRPGDWVIVPAGAQNRETRVRVEEVEYFREDELPMPLERVKRVLRRCERRKKG